MKKLLTAKAPDGQILARTTARHYTHVVIYRKGFGWRALWCGRPDLVPGRVREAERELAWREANGYAGEGPVLTVEVEA